MFIQKSCENPYPEANTYYVWFFGLRLIFREGRFIGWYNPMKKSNK